MISPTRRYSLLDQICLGADQALRAVWGHPHTTGRLNPATDLPEANLTTEQRQHAANLMRVNHAGEVSAQALYHGQGFISQRQDIKEKMQHAAIEEGDHLAWCSTRLSELGSHTSYLNPLWYGGSFIIGLAAGLFGDQWSLGFLAETENQVVQHLENHLTLLPSQDSKSHKILQQMRLDEAQHRDDAIQEGAVTLPLFIKKIMFFTSKMMVKTAYYL